jgi:hypothetical protein
MRFCAARETICSRFVLKKVLVATTSAPIFKSVIEANAFGLEFTEKNMHSGQIPTGAIDAGNKACFDRVIAGRKNNGYS